MALKSKSPRILCPTCSKLEGRDVFRPTSVYSPIGKICADCYKQIFSNQLKERCHPKETQFVPGKETWTKTTSPVSVSQLETQNHSGSQSRSTELVIRASGISLLQL